MWTCHQFKVTFTFIYIMKKHPKIILTLFNKKKKKFLTSCVQDATAKAFFETCSYSVFVNCGMHKALLQTTPLFGATLRTNTHPESLIK